MVAIMLCLSAPVETSQRFRLGVLRNTSSFCDSLWSTEPSHSFRDSVLLCSITESACKRCTLNAALGDASPKLGAK